MRFSGLALVWLHKAASTLKKIISGNPNQQGASTKSHDLESDVDSGQIFPLPKFPSI